VKGSLEVSVTCKVDEMNHVVGGERQELYCWITAIVILDLPYISTRTSFEVFDSLWGWCFVAAGM
jgi:hypothetical protein